MSAPDVSVVIPSYRHAPYVEAAVRSALDAQPPVAVEVVVIDDGSDDGSVEILRRMERDIGDPSRLRVLTQENAGAHAAIERGVREARAEIIAILDSDDLFEPARLETLLPAFDDPEVVVAATWLRIIDKDDREVGIKHAWRDLPPWPRPGGRRFAGPGLAELDDPELSLLEQNWVATTSNFVFRRDLLERGVGFRPLRYAHDWTFLLEAAAHGRIVLVEPAVDALVRYRVHETNTISESAGRGLMRFEILWLLARHVAPTLRRASARLDVPLAELEERAWRSLPRLGLEPETVDRILLQLLALRGGGQEVPGTYDALLAESHPLRRRWVDRLAGAA